MSGARLASIELPGFSPSADYFSELHLHPLRPGRWLVTRPFFHEVELPDLVGQVMVPAGFECDLDSVPRLPLVYALAKGRTVRAAVVHDWLYDSGRLAPGRRPVTRYQADRIFLDAMKDEGVAWGWRALIFVAVRLFGGGYWCGQRAAEAAEG